MGLFNRKTIVSVSSQHSLVSEPEENLDQEAIIAAVLSRTPIANALARSRMEGMYASMERYYQYGKLRFTNGLPEGSETHAIIPNSIIFETIQSEFPTYSKIKIMNSSIDLANTDVFVLDILNNKYKYDYGSGLVKSPPEGMTGNVLFVGTESVDINLIAIKFISDNAPQGSDPVSVIEHVEGYIPDKVFLHALFLADIPASGSEPAKEQIEISWNYEIGSGKYPRVDELSVYEDKSSYYPIVPIRADNVDLTDDAHKQTDLYKTSKFMLNKLNIRIDDITPMLEKNGDINKLDHVNFGIKLDIINDSPIAIEYMGKYFHHLYQTNVKSKELYETWHNTATKSTSPPYTSILIQDDEFRNTLSFLWIDSETRIGNIEDEVIVVGNETTKGPRARSTFQIEPRAEFFTENGGYHNMGEVLWVEQSKVIFEYQESHDVIRKVTVMGLMSIDYIYGKHTIDINLEDAQDYNLEGEFDETTKMMIPIHRGVVKTMLLGDRNELFYHTLHITMSTYDTYKQKWYETSLFGALLRIIAIVLLVMSWGSSSGASASLWALASAVTYFLAVSYIIGLIAMYVLEFVAEKFGIEWAMYIAIAMTVWSMMTGMNKVGPNYMAMLSNGITDAFNKITADIIEGLRNTLKLLDKEMAELENMFENALEAILGNVLDIDIAEILLENHNTAPLYLAQETAENYYKRIEYTGLHINEMVLSMPSLFNMKGVSFNTFDESLELMRKQTA